MKFVQGALVASLSAASFSTALDANQRRRERRAEPSSKGARRRRELDELEVDIGDTMMSMGDGADASLFVEPAYADRDADGMHSKSAKSRPKVEDLIGLDDVAGYTEVAKKFVGLNPKNGLGGGFIVGNANDETNPYITSPEFPVDQPGTGGPRVNLCTCDCKPSPDGVGCVGWAGVAFRYSNMLWKDPVTGAWDGMMQANQSGGNDDKGLNFMGSDRRIYPGGPGIYSLSATDNMTFKFFSGNFRQSNGPVSCKVGLEDKATNAKSEDTSTCAYRCRNTGTYADWIDYCEAGHEDKSLGFSGYGM